MVQNRNPEIDRTIREAFQLKGEFPDTDVKDGVIVVYDVKGTDVSTANNVKVTDGTDSLAVNADGSINIAEKTKRTVTLIEANAAVGTGTTIGTVGAGKIWRIIYAQLSQSIDDAAVTSALSQLNLNGVALINLEYQSVATYGLGSVTSQVRFDYECCPVLTAGQTITQTATINEAWGASIGYVEENA